MDPQISCIPDLTAMAERCGTSLDCFIQGLAEGLDAEITPDLHYHLTVKTMAELGTTTYNWISEIQGFLIEVFIVAVYSGLVAIILLGLLKLFLLLKRVHLRRTDRVESVRLEAPGPGRIEAPAMLEPRVTLETLELRVRNLEQLMCGSPPAYHR